MFPKDNDLEAMFTFESGGERPSAEEPAFRMLMLGDWSGRKERTEISGRRLLSVDRDNFEEILGRVAPSVQLDLSGQAISLEFRELDDFHPDRIFTQVPLFSELRDVRRRLMSRDEFDSAAREVRSWLKVEEPEATPAAEPVAAENRAPGSVDLLEDILSGQAPVRARTPQSEIGNLLRDLVEPYLVRVDENEQARLVAAVDSATGELMRRILHDRSFQCLESAWRALYFVIRKVETDTDLKIFIVDLTKEELAADLKSSDDLRESNLYRWLVRDAVETPGGEPWAVVCGNYGFGPDLDDVATLIRMSKIAVAADAPFVSHVRPEVFGRHSFSDVGATLEKVGLSKDATVAKLWSTLRSQPGSIYLGLLLPRFLARLPYGADTEPLDHFNFEEFTEGPEHDNYLWGNPAFLCAMTLAQTYSAVGWEMSLTMVQDVHGLPTHVYRKDGETVTKPCAEIVMTVDAAESMMNEGVMPLISYRGTDRVRIGRLQSIADPLTQLAGRWR